MFVEGDVIELNYTAKEKDSGQVFDTTMKEEAEKAGIYSEKAKYKPLIIVLGEYELLPGLEKAVKEMSVGEHKEIELNAENGFGERKAELIRIVSLAEFKKQKIQPFPGLILELNNVQGRVQTVSGGRVRVDFNHPLAGKTVKYSVKVEKQLMEEKEKIDAIMGKYLAFMEKEKYSYTIKEEERIETVGKKAEEKEKNIEKVKAREGKEKTKTEKMEKEKNWKEEKTEGKERVLEIKVNDEEKMPLMHGIKPFLERKLRLSAGIERIEVIYNEKKEQ